MPSAVDKAAMVFNLFMRLQGWETKISGRNETKLVSRLSLFNIREDVNQIAVSGLWEDIQDERILTSEVLANCLVFAQRTVVDF